MRFEMYVKQNATVGYSEKRHATLLIPGASYITAAGFLLHFSHT